MKIAIITSTRAEYGLLFPLIKALTMDEFFQVQVIVTGTHLLDKYGKTIQFIEDDGVKIAYQLPIMDEDAENTSAIIAKAIVAFDAVYRRENYDAIIVLGDRYELYGFCIPALMERIPIIHIHGGEKTEGAIDERIRHSITKMASVHFPSTTEYANRIIQMGENPRFVFPVGALGIDNIMHLATIPQHELEEDLLINFSEDTALVTFHPVTLNSMNEIEQEAKTVFSALSEYPMNYIVTMPNSDMGGDITRQVIEEYVNKYPSKFVYFKSLGQKRYLSVLHYVKMVIGNSSSGIIEVPCYRIPTINIGERQQGRFSPDTVIHCNCSKTEILKAIDIGMSKDFRTAIKTYKNPYGEGNTAQKICKVLKLIDLKSNHITKKQFYDIKFEVK